MFKLSKLIKKNLGAIGVSLVQPKAYLVGCSGGIFALIGGYAALFTLVSLVKMSTPLLASFCLTSYFRGKKIWSNLFKIPKKKFNWVKKLLIFN